jgi:hypothetical protein
MRSKMKTKCPRCGIKQSGLTECEICGYSLPKITIETNSRRKAVIILSVLLFLSTIFISFQNLYPILSNRAIQASQSRDDVKPEKSSIVNTQNISKPDLKVSTDAYLALKKVEASLESGVNYLELSKVMRDAKYQINLLDESLSTKQKLRHVYLIYENLKDVYYYNEIDTVAGYGESNLYFKSIEKSVELVPALKPLWDKRALYNEKGQKINSLTEASTYYNKA